MAESDWLSIDPHGEELVASENKETLFLKEEIADEDSLLKEFISSHFPLPDLDLTAKQDIPNGSDEEIVLFQNIKQALQVQLVGLVSFATL